MDKKSVAGLRIFESGQFSPRAKPTQKEFGRQIIPCKLAYAIAPNNRADKSIRLHELLIVVRS